MPAVTKPFNQKVAAMLDLSIPTSTLFSMNSYIEAPTNTLILLNMFTPADILHDEDFNDIYEDIKHTVEQYGTVVSLNITRPDPSLAVKEQQKQVVTENGILTETKVSAKIPAFIEGVGIVYVTYSSSRESHSAQRALSGTKFQGRTIITAFQREYVEVNDPQEEENSLPPRTKKEENDQHYQEDNVPLPPRIEREDNDQRYYQENERN